MTQATLVDGLGQLHTRIYASVGALPAPFLGAMAIVDGGTGGNLYISLHDISGSLAWIAFTALYDAVVVNPSSTDNHIVQSTSGAFGLAIDSEGPGAAIQARGGYEALDVAQLDGATVPLVSGSRNEVVSDQPLLRLRPDTSTDTIQVNGYGEISVIAYSSLPAMTSDHLGAIIRVLGTGVQDKFYMGVLDASSTPIWTQFIGPTGATGAAGAPGVTPELREFGGYIQVSYDDGVTWTNLVPLADITGPAGPAGSVNFPDLPAPGDPPVTFTMIVLARGTMLPYEFPAGYTIQVDGGDGYYVIHDPAQDYIVPAEGSAVYNESNGFAIGRTLARFSQVDSGGLITGTQPTDLTTGYDALTVLTIEIDGTLVELYANSASPGTQDSYILAEVTITPGAATTTHHFDFLTGEHCFVRVPGDNSGNETAWASGVGWSDYWTYIGIQLPSDQTVLYAAVYCDLTMVQVVFSPHDDNTAGWYQSTLENVVSGFASAGGEIAMNTNDWIMFWSEDGVIHPSHMTSADITVAGSTDPWAGC